jgi:catechol 2,3-dioxygenase-like lactoylglutathione lyase family enzyme
MMSALKTVTVGVSDMAQSLRLYRDVLELRIESMPRCRPTCCAFGGSDRRFVRAPSNCRAAATRSGGCGF